MWLKSYLSRCVYLVYFHALSMYDGPFLAKFTTLYSAYHAWKGDIHTDIYRCHQKYGDYVRYAPNRLAINTAQGLQEIYGHGNKVTKCSTYKFLAQQAPNTLTFTDKAQHGSRRRVLSQGFSESSLRLFEPKIHIKLQKLVSVIKGQQHDGEWTVPIDMAATFSNFAFDMMTDIIFSADYNTMCDANFRYAMSAVEESNIRLGVLLQSESLATGGIDRRLFPTSVAAGRRFVKFLRILLKHRLQADKSTVEPHSPDFFSFLEKCRDPNTGKGLSTAEVSTETATFVVAGSDTTSTTLAGLAHYLTGSSKWYRNVAAEIRSTFTCLDDIKLGPKLNSCVALRACMDESLRLSPPGGSALWREVETGGARIDGQFIPEGCDVGVGIYSIHHDPRYWTDALEFRPERWLESDKKGKQPYMPFSIGPRSCVGKPLAIAQVMVTFARLLFEFDIRRADSAPSWSEDGVETMPAEYALEDHVSARKEGPVLCFRSRRTNSEV
ncbi:hypothetical protein M409DRAFT_71434 [Zasmidium cellare ATCC 36951]|uniref:Cytochrome P450 n=1 Tax=Zasmidium cellare ATCC 36951 TaxID=1080233 RepID=A0A6A6BVK2_ZASCE|nr:uncharacterized protein M409DRAFT_71434 [Zasmidium cellare ATCC 36951]KAF2158801.1 hypothetical protein M409DRAFT_71434 [Zasmidium cellare ATCC 36951]